MDWFNADWAMVIITSIYVVATIIICAANMSSVKVAKKQLAEMKKQYDADNRPFIEYEVLYEKRSFFGVRLVNHGRRTAQHVKIQIDEEFISSLPEKRFQDGLRKIKGKECIIGVGQHYDFFVGSNRLRGNTEMKPLTGLVAYSAENTEYQCDIHIDLLNYMTIYSINTYEDDVLHEIEKQTRALEDIRDKISQTDIED